MLFCLLFLFHQSLCQIIQHRTNNFIDSSCLDLLEKNDCYLFINFQGMNSSSNQICYKNDYNDRKIEFCMNTYFLECIKEANQQKTISENYYEILKTHSMFIITLYKRSIKQILENHIKYFNSTNLVVLIAILIFVFPLLIIISIIITNKINKVNRSQLQPFVDSLINQKQDFCFSSSYVKWLCKTIRPVFLSELSLLELEPPIYICGDIHGHFDDLLKVFEKGGLPPKATYLFLGDYVDRGDKSVDVICLLFALKLLYPKNIYLLRGNHESPDINDFFGFFNECVSKINDSIWDIFNSVFDALPVAALVGKQYFCVHGGLSPYMQTLDEINEIERPTSVFDDYILADVLWTDPKSGLEGWGPNPRGDTKTWGLDVAENFIKQNNIQFIVRGHQMAVNGFDFPFYPIKNTITVFTASKYDKYSKNKAAMMFIDNEKKFSFITW